MTAYEVATRLAAIVGASMWSDSNPSWGHEDDWLGTGVECRVDDDTCGPRVRLGLCITPDEAEAVLKALKQKMEEEG